MKKMNKTKLSFYLKDGIIYLLETSGRLSQSNEHYIALKNMTTSEIIFERESSISQYTEMSEDDVYIKTKEMSDEEYSIFMSNVGAYTCPFCGGKLHWESDFMTSEVRGLEHGYYKVDSEDRIAELQCKENELLKSGILGTVETVDDVNSKLEETDSYQYMIVKDKNGNYYEIDDPVIGIYECGNCGKRYEIQDPYEHED